MNTEPQSTIRQKEFFTLRDAATHIGCTRRFLERRIDDGELSTFRPSRRLVRIKRTELERWIETFTRRGSA